MGSTIYLYVLVAIALTDNPTMVPLKYFDTISGCQVEKNKIDPTINKSYVTLRCIPVKAIDESSNK
jgi:hypothetical protein